MMRHIGKKCPVCGGRNTHDQALHRLLHGIRQRVGIDYLGTPAKRPRERLLGLTGSKLREFLGRQATFRGTVERLEVNQNSPMRPERAKLVLINVQDTEGRPFADRVRLNFVKTFQALAPRNGEEIEFTATVTEASPHGAAQRSSFLSDPRNARRPG
jgi:hypothetical protein